MATTATKREYNEGRKFYFALGQFVHAYAIAEGMWHEVLRVYSGIDDKIARAMIGGMRGNEVISTFRKVTQIIRMSDKGSAAFDALAKQFHDISDFRNRLIHRGAEYNSDFSKLISTNQFFYRTIDDFESLSFTNSDIKKATRDLMVIMTRLAIICARERAPDVKISSYKYLGHWARSPWRYKRLTPETPNLPPKSKSSPKRERPPSSSRAKHYPTCFLSKDTPMNAEKPGIAKKELESLDLLPKDEALKRTDNLLRAMLRTPPDPHAPKPKKARKKK